MMFIGITLLLMSTSAVCGSHNYGIKEIEVRYKEYIEQSGREIVIKYKSKLTPKQYQVHEGIYAWALDENRQLHPLGHLLLTISGKTKEMAVFSKDSLHKLKTVDDKIKSKKESNKRLDEKYTKWADKACNDTIKSFKTFDDGNLRLTLLRLQICACLWTAQNYRNNLPVLPQHFEPNPIPIPVIDITDMIKPYNEEAWTYTRKRRRIPPPPPAPRAKVNKPYNEEAWTRAPKRIPPPPPAPRATKTVNKPYNEEAWTRTPKSVFEGTRVTYYTYENKYGKTLERVENVNQQWPSDVSEHRFVPIRRITKPEADRLVHTKFARSAPNDEVWKDNALHTNDYYIASDLLKTPQLSRKCPLFIADWFKTLKNDKKGSNEEFQALVDEKLRQHEIMWAERKEIYRLKVEQTTLGNHFWTISFWEKKNCWVLEKWYYDVTGNNNQQMYTNWKEFEGMKNPPAIFLDPSHRSSYYKLGADRPKDEDKWYPSRWFRKGDGSINILDCETLADYKARETTVRTHAAEHKINKYGKTEKDMERTVEEISSEIRVTGFPLLTDSKRETRRQTAFRKLTSILEEKKTALKQANHNDWFWNYWVDENTEMINCDSYDEVTKAPLRVQLPRFKANATEAAARVEELNRDIKHIHYYLYLLKYGTIAHVHYKCVLEYQLGSDKMIDHTKRFYRKREFKGNWKPKELADKLSDEEIREAEDALKNLLAGLPAISESQDKDLWPKENKSNDRKVAETRERRSNAVWERPKPSLKRFGDANTTSDEKVESRRRLKVRLRKAGVLHNVTMPSSSKSNRRRA